KVGQDRLGVMYRLRLALAACAPGRSAVRVAMAGRSSLRRLRLPGTEGEGINQGEDRHEGQQESRIVGPGQLLPPHCRKRGLRGPVAANASKLCLAKRRNFLEPPR